MRPELPSHQNQKKITMGNYISILNTHMDITENIFNKLLVSQIQQYMKRIIYNHQVGFILSIQSWFKIQKLMTINHPTNRLM